MVSSIIEYKVREGLKAKDEIIIGPGNVKMKKPTFRSIYRSFQGIYVCKIHLGGNVLKKLINELRETQKKILQILKLEETIFTEKS